MSEMVERVARALCEKEGYDPDALEPGDDPYMNDTSVIDGRNRKDEPCHFFWRGYDGRARAAIEAMREPTLEMGDKMRDVTGAGYPYSPDPIPPLGHLQIGLIWRTGIDAALSIARDR